MQIVRDHGLDPAHIAAVRVATYQVALDVTGNFQPTTAFEARFSLPYVVAHGLLHGAVRLDAFQPQRMADPAIRALMARITLTADAEPDRRLPAPARRARGDRDGRWEPAHPLRPVPPGRPRGAARRRHADRQVHGTRRARDRRRPRRTPARRALGNSATAPCGRSASASCAPADPQP